jgi:hypothetical protein
MAQQNLHQRLHRKPYFTHPRLNFIPNIVINLISLLISFAAVAGLLYLVFHYLINKFYHLD